MALTQKYEFAVKQALNDINAEIAYYTSGRDIEDKLLKLCYNYGEIMTFQMLRHSIHI